MLPYDDPNAFLTELEERVYNKLKDELGLL